MSEQNIPSSSLRYHIDFQVLPEIIMSQPKMCLLMLENHDMSKFVCDLFNRTYTKETPFIQKDFQTHRYNSGGDLIYLMDLPDTHDGSRVWCEAYGFCFHKNGETVTPVFLTIESSVAGVRMLCGVDVENRHINFGVASDDNEKNIKTMFNIIASRP